MIQFDYKNYKVAYEETQNPHHAKLIINQKNIPIIYNHINGGWEVEHNIYGFYKSLKTLAIHFISCNPNLEEGHGGMHHHHDLFLDNNIYYASVTSSLPDDENEDDDKLSRIYLPQQLHTNRQKYIDYYKPLIDDYKYNKKIKNYNLLNFQPVYDKIYGGRDLRELFKAIEFEIVNVNERTVNIKLVHQEWPSDVLIKGMSFKQLLIESSYGYVNANERQDSSDKWDQLTTQQKVELCQNELSRWSVKLMRNGQAITPIKIIADNAPAKWIEQIEITNNCTTNRGFELRVTPAGLDTYHGSFVMPQNVYTTLCNRQGGSWAKQGWSSQDTAHVISTGIKFSDIYYDVKHAKEFIELDLAVYRTLTGQNITRPIKINTGEIDYRRWKGAKEYYTKPGKRGLISTLNQKPVTKKQPTTYNDLLKDKYKFKLPEFHESGIYDVVKGLRMLHYPQLASVEKAVISKTTSTDLYEIQLINTATNLERTDLHKIIIGNIKLTEIPIYPNYKTIHRFCFNPRDTSSEYDHQWLPANELYNDKKAPYACLLAANTSGDKHIYIQPESWGLERAILSYVDRGKKKLTIDLISYERIIPVWQGEIENMNVII